MSYDAKITLPSHPEEGDEIIIINTSAQFSIGGSRLKIFKSTTSGYYEYYNNYNSTSTVYTYSISDNSKMAYMRLVCIKGYNDGVPEWFIERDDIYSCSLSPYVSDCTFDI